MRDLWETSNLLNPGYNGEVAQALVKRNVWRLLTSREKTPKGC
jgi:hypothetical protein